VASSDLQISWASSYINSSYNAPGVKSPAIDALIAVAAQGDKDKLLPLGRALDRVLTWNYYMLPMWYMGEDRVAQWNKFSQPAVRPIYSLGFDNWWYDVNKAANCPQSGVKEQNGCLSDTPLIAGYPYAVGDYHH
jgi:microcin C transport system substrate-binding protein